MLWCKKTQKMKAISDTFAIDLDWVSRNNLENVQIELDNCRVRVKMIKAQMKGRNIMPTPDGPNPVEIYNQKKAPLEASIKIIEAYYKTTVEAFNKNITAQENKGQ